MLAAEYPDVTLWAIPLFAATIGIEIWIVQRWRRTGDHVVRGYAARDTWASLAMGLGSVFFVFFINLAVFAIAVVLWPFRLWDLGNGWAGWVVALVGWDLLYYWHHRFEHQIRLLWACHVNHHSSEYFNLSTALRQPWTPWASIFFYPLLALVGVAPWMIMVSGGINLIYQYWVHTEAIDRLPRAIEAVWNTPSHHRVHHGSNPEYIDRNYAGILIVWDRAFGTFEPERAHVQYGLTKNIDTYNPLRIAFDEYAALWRDVLQASRWQDGLKLLWRGPYWEPTPRSPG